jgi:predicted O-methyltransferase YrrM
LLSLPSGSGLVANGQRVSRLALFPAKERYVRPALALGCRPWAFHLVTEAAIFGSDVTEILDNFVTEDEPLLTARGNAGRMGGAVPVSAVTGATLRFLAAAIGARAVVEIGTGYGTSGIWLLRGMRAGSVLTSVDLEPEHHRYAREVFAAAGFPASRYRLITGRARQVLPRLADGAYDLVFCDADYREYPEYLADAMRLLRPGGIIAFDNALSPDPAANAARSEPDTTTLLEFRDRAGGDPGLVPMLLPIGCGLLAAVKRSG